MGLVVGLVCGHIAVRPANDKAVSSWIAPDPAWETAPLPLSCNNRKGRHDQGRDHKLGAGQWLADDRWRALPDQTQGALSRESYSKIEPDPDTGMPGGLGFATISGLTSLMRDNKDRQMMARMGGMKP